MSCDSLIIIALGYRLDNQGSRAWFPVGAGKFSSRTALGPTQPYIQWVPGILSRRVKRAGREADHSPPSSAEISKAWSYTSISHTSLWRGA